MIPAQPVTRASQLVAAVERRIADESLPPGAFLGTRESLRQESGLAKATVNEALRLLSERGLVTVRPGRGGGLFVAEENPVVRLRHTLLSARNGDSTMADVIEVRDVLEPLVAVVASRHCTEDDAFRLRGYIGQLREAARTADDKRFLAVDWSLHEAIARIGPNEYLRAVYLGTLQPISDASANARLDGQVDKVAYLWSRAEIHSELVEAVLSGDEDRIFAAVVSHGQPPAGRSAAAARAATRAHL
jgi:DNA-binding FadR family transcriptional regulator